jgi:hypothetical protein
MRPAKIAVNSPDFSVLSGHSPAATSNLTDNESGTRTAVSFAGQVSMTRPSLPRTAIRVAIVSATGSAPSRHALKGRSPAIAGLNVVRQDKTWFGDRDFSTVDYLPLTYRERKFQIGESM